MSDHEFEKQVRQKLNDLRFTPSADAWEKIEHGLSQSKRRRAPYFWLPLIVIGLAAGGYFIFSDNTEQAVVSEKMNTSRVTEDNLLTENAKPAVEPQQNKEGTTDKATQNAEKEERLEVKKEDAQTEKQPPVREPQRTLLVNAAEKNLDQLNSDKEGTSVETSLNDQLAITNKSIDRNQQNGNQVFDGSKTFLQYSKIPGQQFILSIKPPSSSIQASHDTRMPGVTNLSPVKPAKINSRKWSFGVYAEAGISAVNEGDFLNFSKPKVQDVAYRASFSGNAIAPSYTPSSLSPGFSYSAGATVKRHLNRKFSLSSGINYLQLNTKNKVGDKVYGSQVVNNGTRGYLYVFNYYRLEQDKPSDYKNRYHFVEIPLSLNTRLNKSQKLPIDWNAGVAVAYLIESNSLHFDGTTGVYYKDDKLLNKTQVAVSTGFSFTIFNKTAFPVSIGPSARYNLSPILHRDVSASKNFMSLGLATRIYLK